MAMHGALHGSAGVKRMRLQLPLDTVLVYKYSWSATSLSKTNRKSRALNLPASSRYSQWFEALK